VEGTIPAHGDLAFCRNAIADIYFNTRLNPATIQNTLSGTLTRNIKIEECNSGDIVRNENKGSVRQALAFVANVFKKLLGLKREAAAELADCEPIDYDLQVDSINNKSVVSVIPINLLAPAKFYQITVSGGTEGIKSINGIILDNSNSPVNPPSALPANQDYIFALKTQGVAGDETTGICDVEWIDLKVYRQPFTDPYLKEAEYRNDDLFTCAGKDTCNFDADYDQDPVTTGNQHIYQAVAKYSGSYTLKANYQWTRNDNFDPQKILDIYNNRGLCQAGDADKINRECLNNTDCAASSGDCNISLGDLSVDTDKVKNNSGRTYVTAKPVKDGQANLIIEAQAQGSTALPVQKSVRVYILMCENPWPSIKERFPVSSIINAYNFQTYYCRDAGAPGPEGDLPGAKILIPNIGNLNILENTDFEFGNLSNWISQAGSLWALEPVKSALTSEGWVINTSAGSLGSLTVNLGNAPKGILSSQAFIIEGDELKFRISGSNHQWPIVSKPDITDLANAPLGVTAVVLATKANPDDPFIIQMQATGDNTNIMRQIPWNVSAFATNRSCTSNADCNGNGTCDENGKCSPIIGIIYIYDNNAGGYIGFDDLKQFKDNSQIPIRY
ncbi:MAG: hypothetical protein NT116_03060, partial [Candidatus Parcubacteria bacterium]|nr:hypothetical protein [Candidatus Parcubacteria bacterium]